MKVNNPNVKSQAVLSSNAQTVESKKIGDTKSAKTSKADALDLGVATKINVSDRAQAMQKAKAIASDDSVDEAKVARFQALIDSGKYKVDAEKIADKLVDDHLLAAE